MQAILAEGAMTLPATPSGGVSPANWKLFQFPSSLIVKVILATFHAGFGPTVRLSCAARLSGHAPSSLCLREGYPTTRSRVFQKDARPTREHISDCLAIAIFLAVTKKQATSREIALWMTPPGAPRALQASERSELLDPVRARCWISTQH